jgi:hypothetical protein
MPVSDDQSAREAYPHVMMTVSRISELPAKARAQARMGAGGPEDEILEKLRDWLDRLAGVLPRIVGKLAGARRSPSRPAQRDRHRGLRPPGGPAGHGCGRSLSRRCRCGQPEAGMAQQPLVPGSCGWRSGQDQPPDTSASGVASWYAIAPRSLFQTRSTAATWPVRCSRQPRIDPVEQQRANSGEFFICM